jgi:hypothetical protein
MLTQNCLSGRVVLLSAHPFLSEVIGALNGEFPPALAFWDVSHVATTKIAMRKCGFSQVLFWPQVIKGALEDRIVQVRRLPRSEGRGA